MIVYANAYITSTMQNYLSTACPWGVKQIVTVNTFPALSFASNARCFPAVSALFQYPGFCPEVQGLNLAEPGDF